LLTSATDIAERDGITALTVGAVTKAAGHAKGTFYVHFEDRADLLVEMHRRFHDDLFAAISRAAEAAPDGPSRARLRIIAFLDGCRQQRGVKSMLFQARHEPVIAEMARQRNEEAAQVLALEIDSATPTPVETAQLLVAATIEVAVQELTSGKRLARLRTALLKMVPD
jgi:AcrR family transcriptional regulator